MLTIDLQSILNSIPNEVNWQDIVQFKKLDQRVAIANEICANLIGVNEGYIEWCPDNNPQTQLETLLWWWVIRPDLGAAIAIEAPQELKEIITNYLLPITSLKEMTINLGYLNYQFSLVSGKKTAGERLNNSANFWM
jgi:hypothetical protein